MAIKEHLEILKQGVGAWKKWRKENPNIVPDLSEADLSGAILIQMDLSGVGLSEADLRGANLNRANLRWAYLGDADLRRVDLSEANLSWADLNRANVSEANLSEAFLGGANLREAILSGADLSGAILIQMDLRGAILRGANLSEAWVALTSFGNVDLSEVEGLETMKHEGPSTIGIDTIFKSQGKIPESFLRGCGVPDELINYLEKIRIPECLYTREQLQLWIENIQNQLTIVIRNLSVCKEAEAKIGNKVDLALFNQIIDLEENQMRLETQLKEYKRLKILYYPQGEQE
jgi:hypothetical protein